MKVCVYGLSFNQKDIVSTWYESVRDSDHILVGDLGSTDGTQEQLASLGVHVVNLRIDPWRYDVARNTLLSLVPRDCTVAFVCDVNQRISENWKSSLVTEFILGTGKLRALYQPINRSIEYYDKIHSATGYHWYNHVYEKLSINPDEQVIITDKITLSDIVQWSYGNTTELIEKAVKDRPHDGELLWRRAVHYATQGQWDRAIECHKQNVETGDSAKWRSESMIHLSGLIQRETQVWLQRAVLETPYRWEPMNELANYYYRQNEWNWCFAYARAVLECAVDQPVITDNYLGYKLRAHDMACISAWNMTMLDAALFHCKAALELMPTDGRLQNNLNLIKQYIKDRKYDGEL